MLTQLNAGVLLMNLTAIREAYSADEMLEYAQAGAFELNDQDVLKFSVSGRHQTIIP